MWNNPKAAPEHQLGWGDKNVVRKALGKILPWNFERIILAHGNLIAADSREIAVKAWRRVLQDR